MTLDRLRLSSSVSAAGWFLKTDFAPFQRGRQDGEGSQRATSFEGQRGGLATAPRRRAGQA
jgi:hypothetical protein